jgi:hypothetical protein
MRRPLRRAAIALAALALALLAARVWLDRWVTARARGAVEALPGMRGRFADAEVRVRDLSYTLRDLRLEKHGASARTVLAVPRIRIRFAARPLLAGRLVVELELESPRLEVTQLRARGPEPSPGKPQELRETPRVGRGVARLPPLLVERAEVRDGELRYVLAADERSPTVRLHHIELTVENLATRRARARDAPVVLAGSATLQRSGAVSVFATADPHARRPTFAGRARLDGLRFEELGDLVAGSGVEPDRGVLAMAIRFAADEGRVSGAVRPSVEGGGTRAADPGLVDGIKSALADASLDVFGDPAMERAGVTTIPIVGVVKDPDARPLPVVIGLLRNAFVQGLTSALRGPPPAGVRERRGREPG